MHLAFELSGEHETLPKAEVFACLDALSVDWTEKMFSDGILVIDTLIPATTLDVLSNRLGMTHHIYEIFGESELIEEKEILEVVKNANIDIDDILEKKLKPTFAVRVRVKHKKKNPPFLSNGFTVPLLRNVKRK
jgi:tRNA (guanine10-N2)-dimethyltransferase